MPPIRQAIIATGMMFFGTGCGRILAPAITAGTQPTVDRVEQIAEDTKKEVKQEVKSSNEERNRQHKEEMAQLALIKARQDTLAKNQEKILQELAALKGRPSAVFTPAPQAAALPQTEQLPRATEGDIATRRAAAKAEANKLCKPAELKLPFKKAEPYTKEECEQKLMSVVEEVLKFPDSDEAAKTLQSRAEAKCGDLNLWGVHLYVEGKEVTYKECKEQIIKALHAAFPELAPKS